MNEQRWKSIEHIFNGALDLDQDERPRFVARACGDDTALKAEIEELLSETDSESPVFADVNWAKTLAMLDRDRADALIGQMLGNYRIVEHIARGGMGDVYRAEDERLGRVVALKLLLPFISDDRSVARFRREAAAASAISHPNVAHIYEIGEGEGRTFIAMEFVEGITLRERLKSGPMPLVEAAYISRQILDALNAAHLKGVVHRDIKPENIMIRPDGRVQVVDFGLAKLNRNDSAAAKSATQFSSMFTDPGFVLGTINYMSPEQARGRVVDSRTDLWSWGVVFYEMLSGTLPFSGESKSDTIANILKTDVVTDIALLPPQVRPVIQKALAKKRSERYLSASDALADLTLKLFA